MGGPLSLQVGLVALLAAYASPGALAAIITTCSDDTSPWSTCVRTEPDGIVFFPKLKAGAWSQHFYEAKYRV